MLDTMHNPLCIIHPPLCGISLIVRGRGGGAGAGEGPKGCRMIVVGHKNGVTPSSLRLAKG